MLGNFRIRSFVELFTPDFADQTLKQNNKINKNQKCVFFREIGRSVGDWETLPDGPEVRSGFYAARNYMVSNKSWGSHKSTNTVRVWRAGVRIIKFISSEINDEFDLNTEFSFFRRIYWKQKSMWINGNLSTCVNDLCLLINKEPKQG